jgi:Fe-S cluster biosynthesis and repair protein YggX
MATVACARCNRPEAPALPKAPLFGPQGREVLARVCADCWAEWLRTEVMVINELRLNFMDPEAQETLTRHMREFLGFDPPGSTTPPSFPPVAP